MSTHESWVHGTAVLLERNRSPEVVSDGTVKQAFAPTGEGWFTGDIIDIGGYGAVACMRIGWAARFLAYDFGDEDRGKDGTFWCHYSVPVPAKVAGARSRAEKVMLNYETTDFQAIAPVELHVWDGNRRIFADSMPEAANDAFNGGIEERTANSGQRPDAGRLLERPLHKSEIFFGVLVSIRIGVNDSRNEQLEIRGVGIEFEA
jgi:hypothetical protein